MKLWNKHTLKMVFQVLPHSPTPERKDGCCRKFKHPALDYDQDSDVVPDVNSVRSQESREDNLRVSSNTSAGDLITVEDSYLMFELNSAELLQGPVSVRAKI